MAHPPFFDPDLHEIDDDASPDAHSDAHHMSHSAAPLSSLLPPFLQHEVAHFDHHVATGSLTPQIVRRFRGLGEHVAAIERESLRALVALSHARHRQRIDSISQFERETDIGRTMAALDNLTNTLESLMHEHAEELGISINIGVTSRDEEDGDDDDQVATLTQEQIDALPLTVVSEAMCAEREESADTGAQHDCTICHQPLLEPGNVLRTLRCEHRFHRHCVDEWLLHRNVQCPNCRRDQSLVSL